MSSEILLASNNPDKLLELEALLGKLELKLHLLKEFPAFPPTIEDCDTIAGNAMKKALEAAKHTRMVTLADDTGFFIEALSGEPGVFAARYAGENCSYADNRKKVLTLMDGISNRKATFRTAVAMANHGGIIAVVEGAVEGFVTTVEKGESGFGYDSIFSVGGVTYAQMDWETKNNCSHRAAAINAIIPVLQDLII